MEVISVAQSASAQEAQRASQWQRRRENEHPTASGGRSASPGRFGAGVDEFAEETGVYGLSLLRSRRSRLENAFWIACTLAFAVLTIRDLSGLTVSYQRQETLSLTSQITNQSFTLDPAPTIQFTYDRETFDFRHWAPREALAERTDRFIEMFENFSDNAVAPDVVYKQLFELTLTMLGDATINEVKLIFPKSIAHSDVTMEWAYERKGRENHALIRDSVENLYRRLRSRNVDFAKLLRFVTAQMCVKSAFTVARVVEHAETRLDSPCKPMNMLGMDENSFAMKFINNGAPLVFHGPYDSFLLSWNANGTQDVFVDFVGTPQTIWERDNSLLTGSYNKPGERLVVSLGVSALFKRAEEKTTQPCSKTVSRYDCKQRCYISRFVDLCGCYPLYFTAAYPPTSGDVQPCTHGAYNRTTRGGDGVIDYLSACRTINASEETKLNNQCDADCLQDCRTLTFVATVERSTSKNGTQTSEMELKIQSFTFPLIEEKLALSFEAFISQFGGTLGLYIGISFATLVHIPIFAIRKMAEHFHRRRRRSTRKDHSHVRGAYSEDGGIVEMASTWSQGNDAERKMRDSKMPWLQEIHQRFNAIDGQFHAIARRIELIEAKTETAKFSTSEDLADFQNTAPQRDENESPPLQAESVNDKSQKRCFF